MKNKCFAISEAVGCAVIYASAVFLHFVFSWFGPGALSILFGAVNESVWEHVKIFSAAYAGWALFQLLWVKVRFRQYVAAKCAGLYLLMGGVIVFHYGFVRLFGRSDMWADIIGSAVMVVLAQLLSYRMTVSLRDYGEYFAPSICLLTLYYLMFFSFTVYPPKTELFRDPRTGGFGYMEKAVEKRFG